MSEIRHTSAQVIAKIAGAEIPKKQWPDLVQNLQNNVAGGVAPGLKQATLEALGYVCEEVEHEHLVGGCDTGALDPARCLSMHASTLVSVCSAAFLRGLGVCLYFFCYRFLERDTYIFSFFWALSWVLSREFRLREVTTRTWL